VEQWCRASGGSDADQATIPGSPMKALWLIAAIFSREGRLGGVCIQASHTMVQAIMTNALNEARVFSHLSAMRL